MREKPKIHAYLAQHGIASRRKAEAMVQQGNVKVNGHTAVVGQRIDPEQDTVTVNGKSITPGTVRNQDHLYFLIYKPVDYVSTTSDELGRKTVLELIPSQTARLYPVGRLDIESEGLMLLTNDGELTQQLTHPSYEIKKTYRVLLKGFPSWKALDHLEAGVKLKDGWAKPDSFYIIDKEAEATWLEITIHSGRNRIVRRMMERIGYDVLRLVRVEMGPFKLEMLGNAPYVQLTHPLPT